jgi:hypothetical protein
MYFHTPWMNQKMEKPRLSSLFYRFREPFMCCKCPNLQTGQETPGVRVAALRRKLGDLDEQTLVPNLMGRFTGTEWKFIKRYGHIDGRPLYDIGFWDLIRKFLTPEGYNLAHDGRGGCQHLNAADAIVWFLSDFAGSP